MANIMHISKRITPYLTKYYTYNIYDIKLFAEFRVVTQKYRSK